jgi:hypothetical protein
MGEFAHWDQEAMSEETSTKIEPILKPVEDAPPIAAAAPEAPAAELKIEPKPEVMKAEEPAKIEPKIETRIVEPPKAEASAAPAKEPPVMPRAAQIAAEPVAGKAPTWLRPIRARDGKDEKAAHAAAVPSASRSSSRFPLLAATVAVAASLGAIAGSFGGAVFGRAPLEARTAAHGGNAADEIRALKETVAQLRTNTKTLSDNVSALKLSVSNANAQLTKMSETLERRAVAPAAPETTGSIQKPAQVPVVLGAPPAPLQHPVVQGWTLRRVYDGAALIEGRDGIIEVEPGTTIAGLGRIDDIKKQDGRWAVFTSKGIIVAASK